VRRWIEIELAAAFASGAPTWRLEMTAAAFFVIPASLALKGREALAREAAT
jgi:hypothetical protein